MCLVVCVCVFVCVCLRARARACVRARVRVGVRACVRASVRACVRACARLCAFVCVPACVSVRMSVRCVLACACACVRACACVCIPSLFGSISLPGESNGAVCVCVWMSLSAWCAGVGGDIRHLRGRCSNIDRAALAPLVREALGDRVGEAEEVAQSKTAVINGFLTFELSAVVHPLHVLAPHEREQLRFWQTVCRQDLNGKAYIFNIRHCTELPMVLPLERSSARRPRGLVTLLDQAQVISLQQQLPPARAEDATPCAVRMPYPWAVLACSRRWPSFLLPNVRSAGRGASTWLLSWDLLGIPHGALPQAPAGAAQVRQQLCRRRGDVGERADRVRWRQHRR